MGISQTRQSTPKVDVGCSNCKGVYIPNVNTNCAACEGLFKRLVRKPLKKKFKRDYNMKFVRNHIIVYNESTYNARLACRIILDHIGFREFGNGARIRKDNYIITLVKPAASKIPTDEITKDLDAGMRWFGVSLRITPYVASTHDVASE